MHRLLMMIAMCLGSLAVAGAETFPLISARQVATPPTIDGRLDEACWSGEEATAPFVAIGGAAVPFTTRGRLCWDADYLYIGLTCPEPDMALLRPRLQQGKLSPMEESIEIFLDASHDHHSYLQFRIGLQGERDTSRGTNRDFALDAHWRGAAHLGEDGWTAEAAIPFRLLEARPTPDALWGLNLNRQRVVTQAGMWTCWSDTKGGFHSPSRFGHLVFAPYAEWLTAHYRQHLAVVEEDAQQLRARYPHSTAGHADQTDGVLAQWQAFFARVQAADLPTGDACLPLYADGEKLVTASNALIDALRLAILKGGFR
jgi:hypothetical protein